MNKNRNRSPASQFTYKHGLWDHPLYKTWNGMMARCYRSNTNGYERWGGRGIKVCERWHNVINFIEDMGAKPTPEHTLDRKNPGGNYEPNNCRWATRLEQSHNTRIYKNNKTGVLGITYGKGKNELYFKYRVAKQIGGKRRYLGTFITFKDAKAALDKFLAKEGRGLYDN